ncbi:transcript variant X1 [Nothobranchius furzeri]|uniref:Transcript variant X1 n=1 Tax=Nothobranchius furzeri TaxID=105023 RepID=A0A9D2Z043_NOTFU|nr:transcript variant X1 [Nothobranchius furzeri]
MGYQLIFIGLTALFNAACAQNHQYYFVNTPRTWKKAQAVCRHNYTDLATITNIDDIAAVVNTTASYTGKTWIGLYDDVINGWKWSQSNSSFYGDGQTTYRNWYPGYPNNYAAQQQCVTIYNYDYLGRWMNYPCNYQLPFVCYNGEINGSPSFVLRYEYLNWTDAQNVCRKNYVGLARVQNQSENDIIRNQIGYTHAWIGLHWEKSWSDGSSSLFRYWADNYPTNYYGSKCTAAAFNDSGKWSDEECQSSLPFICYKNDFHPSEQNETSISLQWSKVNNNISFVLQFNGTETNISAPDGDGPVTYTVSSLTAGSKYTFTLLSVFENIRSSGVQLTAATAPLNADGFRASGQDETSIALQWNKVSNDVSFVLQFNGTELTYSAPTGDGPVTHTVSSLTAGTKYTFTLFSVFENVWSSGVSITAAIALFNAAFAQNHQYYFVNTPRSWREAQTICRRDYTDLATITNMDDVAAVVNTTSSYKGKAWIGLHDNLVNSWKWSLTDSSFYGEGETTYRNWLPGYVNYQSTRQCAYIYSYYYNYYQNGKWLDNPCTSQLPFVCYNGIINGSPSFVYRSESLSWTDAQIFCRENYVDLASVRSQKDNDIIRSLFSYTVAWIGLYREKLWSDGSSSAFQYWANYEPNGSPAGYYGPKCIAASYGDSGKWSDEECMDSLPFVCYRNDFHPSEQNETSITLQWSKVNNNISFVLQFNGTETNVSAPDGDGPVTQTFSSLTAGTKYTFTLFSVFENIRSSGVQLTAATAPLNADGFRSSEQDETSITLQWNQVNNDVSFVLQLNGAELTYSAPTGDGPVTHIISSLTAGTEYTFTLFSVFENIRSSGVSITASTAVLNAAFAKNHQYYFVNTPRTWKKAQAVCRHKYTDLATITNKADVAAVVTTTSSYTGKAWIGLNDDLLNGWKWSLSDSSYYVEGNTTYRNWYPGYPSSYITQQECVRMYAYEYSGRWFDTSCISLFPFVCYNGEVNGSPSFIFRTESLNWTDAQKFCRENYVDLASVRNQTENDIIRNLIGYAEAWIGLYWDKSWSDGSSSVFRYWANYEPNHYPGSYNSPKCIAASYSDSGKWSDEDCRGSLPLICYRNDFHPSEQNETSITLQWSKVNNSVSFVLQFNGTETSISAPDGDGPVTYTVSSLTAGTKYTFTLFSVFENIWSSGEQLTTATAPLNADGFRSSGQDQTSITLQWNKVNNVVSFILQFNDAELTFSGQTGDGPVTHIVAPLTVGTEYTFTLFSVFENVWSSGVSITASTAMFNAPFAQNHQYYFVNTPRTWREAQTICRRDYTDLATITNIKDVAAVVNTTSRYTGQAWIGLYDDMINGWRWSLSDSSFYGEGETTYRNWYPGYQNIYQSTQTCASMYGFDSYYRWYGYPCTNQLPFVCYNGQINGSQSFVFITESLNWMDAQSFCRENYIDLASVRNQTENSIIRNLIGYTQAWIGLYREKLWSDGSSSLFQYWSYYEPNGYPGNYYDPKCIAASSYDSGKWSDEQCTERLPFICYRNDFHPSKQNETSITLQWSKVNNSVSFVLQFNGTETNISAPAGDGPVTYTVSSLTAGTKYTFTLFSVFENIWSSGVELTAATAPLNADGFRSSGQDQTSITLQWNKVNNGVSFVLQFNGAELKYSAPAGDGLVAHTVSSLTAGTEYTFTLFSVFENVRSSGVSITASTALFSAAFAQNHHYYFMNTPRSWREARTICRHNYTDLATITNMDDVATVINATSSYTGKAWIGLYDDMINGWKWSLPDSSFYGERETTYRNWLPGYPSIYVGQQQCVYLSSYYDYYYSYSEGRWLDNPCSSLLQFVCYNGQVNGTPSFVFRTESLNWADAQTFCRENYVDLASIRNPTENRMIRNLIGNTNAWIGLYRERLWSDGSSSLFRFWANYEPNGYYGPKCIAASYYESGKWSDDECSANLPFICYRNDFHPSKQNETSITLQWSKVNNSVNFVLQFNGTETNISAPTGDGPVTQTFSSLIVGTKYTFTLFSVFENIRSSGVELTTATAPLNADGFRASGQNENSIFLQWNQVNNVVSFVLQYNGTELTYSGQTGDGPVTHIVSSLTAGTTYTFTLFSVFENIWSSGVSITASTALFNAAFAQNHQYHFVNTPRTWTEARAFCRANYTDLATITNIDDVAAVVNTTSSYTGKAWIGLYDDMVKGWKWSLSDSSFYGEGETTYRNWYWYYNYQYYNDRQQHCAYMYNYYYNGQWSEMLCTSYLPFVCYNGHINGRPSFVFRTESLTWTEAQTFCRENYVDLASVRNQTENEIIRNLIGYTNAWIGLYREKLWSDGSNSQFQNWANYEPNGYGPKCIASSYYDSGKWSDEECTDSLPFICYTNGNLTDYVARMNARVRSQTQLSESEMEVILAEYLKQHGLPHLSSLKVRFIKP